MQDNRRAAPRPLGRLVRLPKDPVLHAGVLEARDERRADGEPGASVGHVGVVPYQEAVLVAFAEARGCEAGVDAYGAVVWWL